MMVRIFMFWFLTFNHSYVLRIISVVLILFLYFSYFFLSFSFLNFFSTFLFSISPLLHLYSFTLRILFLSHPLTRFFCLLYSLVFSSFHLFFPHHREGVWNLLPSNAFV